MIRQMVRSAALFAAGLLLANVAWGQDPVLSQTSSAAAYVATEHFGGAEPRVVQVSDMDLDRPEELDPPQAANGQQRPYVQLLLTGGPVTDGNTADITFELMGATFQQTASPTHLDQRTTSCAEASPEIGDDIEATVVEGGERGDSSVTYRVEVTDTGAENFVVNQALCFWIPDLSVTLDTVDEEAMPPVQGVNVTATAIKPVASTGTPFPSEICGAPTTMPENACPKPSGAEVRILQATPALTAGLGMGGTAYVVDLEKRLTIGRGGTRDPSATGNTDAAMGLSVGSLSVGVSQLDIFELDGSGVLPKDSVHGSLSGRIDLTIGGRFQSGDKLVVGSGPTALMAEIAGSVAEASVQIELIPGMPIVYVPGGVDVLKPGTFTAAGAHLFNDRRNLNGPFGMSHGELKYAGIEVEGYAYGVVRGNGTDTSYVRVTCESVIGPACAIFADCTGQDGMEYFEAAPPIPAGATVAWNSNDIEGLMGDGWTGTPGRGRCDVYSNGELSVQHMVRSGHTLINSSAVVGRSLDLRADRARATIDMVVDNICDSVQGHSGRAFNDQGDTDPSNDVAAVDPTVCRNELAAMVPAP